MFRDTNNIGATNVNWNSWIEWPYEPPAWPNPTFPCERFQTWKIETITMKPDIKVLKVNGKLLFYYWDEKVLYYCLYSDEMTELKFESTHDFLEVLNKLGVLK